jgi:dipeptidase E
MEPIVKLLLSSFGSSPEHDAALVELVGKPLSDIRVAYIENAYDVYHDETSLVEGREILQRNGYSFDLVDLRDWRTDRAGLRAMLDRFDAFLLTGGNPYYLRSLMKVTGADEIVTDLVENGAVYAGASASAVVAGPTLRHFDELDDPAEAEEVIWDGLSLTNIVVAPHVDNPEFGPACRKSGDLCERDGYSVQRLTDSQALVIDGDRQRVV